VDDLSPERRDVALVELLDRVVDHGVVLSGDITISVADVDLIYLGLRVLIRTPVLTETGSSENTRSANSDGADDYLLRLRGSADQE
jgi:hypothetical protein